MAIARAYHGAAVVQSAATGYNALYVVGGSSLGDPNNNTGVLSSVEVFAPPPRQKKSGWPVAGPYP